MRTPFFCALLVGSGILLATAPCTWADDPGAARFRGTGTADPIRIDNVAKVAGKVAGQAGIRCDVAWNHSWRAAWKIPAEAHGGTKPLDLENWDAAWLFAKYRAPGANGWSPATLSATATDHATPPAASLDVGLADDGKTAAGVFVFRAGAGSGPNDWKGVTLGWLHAADGVADPAAVEVRVFAINMVYVPECSFWLGDGGTEFIGAQFSAGDSIAPYRLEGEAELTLGGTDARNLGNRDTIGQFFRTDDFTSGTPQLLPAHYPKGYAAFYCMRHELTEGQVVEYFNSLSLEAQKANPVAIRDNLKTYHNVPMGGITVKTLWEAGAPAVYTTQTPHVACDSVVAYEGRAYAAWAGLRPMTELEYEKAARGPLKPVPDEHAWGTAAIVGGKKSDPPACPRGGYVVANAGQPDERVTWQGDGGPDATRGNATWLGATRCEGRSTTPPDAVQRPLRAEIFATPESDRIAAGASYWGIMELSGNLGERVISVGNIAGRRFTGGHGAPQSPSVTYGSGSGLRRPEEWGWGTSIRGGGMMNGSRNLRVSDRHVASNCSALIPTRHRNHSGGVGFRCVRTARIVPRAAGAGETATTTPLHLNNSVCVANATSGWGADALVVIKNLAVAPRDDRTATLTFDISWPESWRTEHNHDAAWVFFKANGAGSGWRHVKLVADKVLNPTGYGQADVAGSTKVDLIVPDGPDGFTGLFVRRAAPGKGPMDAQQVTVVCAADAVRNLAEAKDSVRGLGVPMVYVPEGGFLLGSYGAEVGSFHEYGDGKTPAKAYRVTGPGPIPVGKQPGRLWARNHGGPLQEGEIPATYPNGYAAFYCMRFQITPSLYADMLNMLDPKMVEERHPAKDRYTYNKTVYSGKNGAVRRGEDGIYVGIPGRERAGPGCFGISWADGATFAAWAGLRPLTELELEKAVRGPRDAAPNEVGPSYWGISGFGGDDWDAFKGDAQCERPVTAGPAGLRFKATHGMGTTTLPADWPQADAVGSGVRCSHYSSDNLERLRGLVESPGFFLPSVSADCELPRARLADRLFAGVPDPERLWSHKWRGARTAPKGVGP